MNPRATGQVPAPAATQNAQIIYQMVPGGLRYHRITQSPEYFRERARARGRGALQIFRTSRFYPIFRGMMLNRAR